MHPKYQKLEKQSGTGEDGWYPDQQPQLLCRLMAPFLLLEAEHPELRPVYTCSPGGLRAQSPRSGHLSQSYLTTCCQSDCSESLRSERARSTCRPSTSWVSWLYPLHLKTLASWVGMLWAAHAHLTMLWAGCAHLICKHFLWTDEPWATCTPSPADATLHGTLASTETLLPTLVPALALAQGKDLHGHRIGEAQCPDDKGLLLDALRSCDFYLEGDLQENWGRRGRSSVQDCVSRGLALLLRLCSASRIPQPDTCPVVQVQQLHPEELSSRAHQSTLGHCRDLQVFVCQ